MFVLGYRYDGVKRATFGSSFWNNEEQARNSLSRRDVPTSRRRVNNENVNDVPTSRRRHVATSPRRDVSSKIYTSSFKVRMALKLGYREAYEQRHGFPEQSDTVFEEVPGICTAFHVFDILGY